VEAWTPGCLRLDPRVVERLADGEVIERLKARVGELEQLVEHIVEEAADAGAPKASRFGLEVERMSEYPGSPVE
jgi:hypothetical protein